MAVLLPAIVPLSVYILAPALVADGLYRMTLSAQSAAKLIFGFALISAVLYGFIWSFNNFLKLAPNTHKSLLI